MNNFNICYNALCRAFDKKNVAMSADLVKILKPDNVQPSITLTNTSNIDSESEATTNNNTDSSDESDNSDDIDLNKTIRGNVNSKRYDDDDVAYGSLSVSVTSKYILNSSQRTQLSEKQIFIETRCDLTQVHFYY